MQNDSNWMLKYYSREAQEKIAEQARTFTAEMQAQVAQAWKDYFLDRAALTRDGGAGGEKAEELSKRHRELVAAFTGNDPEVEAGLRALYRDQSNWPPEFRERMKEYEA